MALGGFAAVRDLRGTQSHRLNMFNQFYALPVSEHFFLEKMRLLRCFGIVA